MSEMTDTPAVAVVAMLVLLTVATPGLAAAGSAGDFATADSVATGDVLQQTASNADNESENGAANETTGGPGAALSGAVGGEDASLDSELESTTYRLQLLRAPDPDARAAILDRMASDLELSLDEVRDRRAVANETDLHPGKAAYLTTRVTVERRALEDLATRGSELSLALSFRDDAHSSLVERFRDVGLDAGNLSFDPDRDVDVPEEFRDGDSPVGNWSEFDELDGISLDGTDGGSLDDLDGIDFSTFDGATLAALNETGVVELSETDLDRYFDGEFDSEFDGYLADPELNQTDGS